MKTITIITAAIVSLAIWALLIGAVICITALDWAGPVYGAERFVSPPAAPAAEEGRGETPPRPYYIYRDARGVVVIGNQTPPDSATILKRYDWRDSTDAEIAATAAENRRTEARLFAREVLDVEREAVKATAALADEMRKAREATAAPVRVEVGASAIAAPRAIPNAKFHIPNSKNLRSR